MNKALRGAVALCVAVACLLTLPALAQSLDTDRDRLSYMVGMDIGRSLEPVGPDLDFAALQRALEHAFAGGEALVDPATASTLGEALSLRAAVRSGQPIPGQPPGTAPPEVDREQAALMIGADVARSLVQLQDEIDVAPLMRALRTRVEGGELLMSQAEADALRADFARRIQARQQAEAAQQGERNRAEGATFMDANRTNEGVITTGSGLQYMVMEQGTGRRPLPHDRVRVHYHGTLLDGTVFDSSRDRGQPADFGLGQVIPGWTEGLGLMQVGARYRFWIPGHLAYGANGTPGGPIGPHATLVFDVELIDVL